MKENLKRKEDYWARRNNSSGPISEKTSDSQEITNHVKMDKINNRHSSDSIHWTDKDIDDVYYRDKCFEEKDYWKHLKD